MYVCGVQNRIRKVFIFILFTFYYCKPLVTLCKLVKFMIMTEGVRE